MKDGSFNVLTLFKKGLRYSAEMHPSPPFGNFQLLKFYQQLYSGDIFYEQKYILKQH